jgi:ankyrin repeat protein
MTCPTNSLLAVVASWVVALVTLSTAEGQGPPTKRADESGPTPEIILAVRQQDYARIESLLAKGADPLALAGRTPSAWVWAVLLRDNRSLKLLLQDSRRLDDARMAGFGLMVAVSHGDRAAVRILLDKGIKVNGVELDGTTALLLAAGNGDSTIVRLLLESGADANAGDSHGDTPLMAAVRAGPIDAVHALLDGGAKPDKQDKQGRSAAAWAARYGRDDLVKLLVSKGAATPGRSDEARAKRDLPTARDSALRTLPLLQRGAANWTDRAGCVSCHHQYLMVHTVAVARRQGFLLDDGLLRAQDSQLQKDRDQLASIIKPALTDEASMTRLTARSGRPVFEVAFSLAALAENAVKPDGTTEVMARFLAKSQNKDGRWWHGLPRAPLKSSDFTATACAIRALQAYAPASEAKATAERIRHAATWLENTETASTEDKVFRLRGLKWAGAEPKVIAPAAELLKKMQNRDGGWGQMPGLNSDAYATGEALVALRDCGDVTASDDVFRRGIRYLLETQEKDGTWMVHKRAVPFNAYFETGFPQGKFQISSFAGTSWATMALMLAEPAPVRRSKP